MVIASLALEQKLCIILTYPSLRLSVMSETETVSTPLTLGAGDSEFLNNL